MDIDTIKKMLTDKINSSVEPKLPEALNDECLEDAFKTPEYNEEGYASSMPGIWDSNSYGKTPDGVKILSLRSARSASGLYSRFLDKEALVWDAAKQELSCIFRMRSVQQWHLRVVAGFVPRSLNKRTYT